MISFLDTILWLFILAVIGAMYWYLTIPKNLPPGPLGLPLLGSSLDYLNGSNQHLVLQKHIQKYGPVLKLYIANKLVIVLGDYDTIQEALIKQADTFAGRPQLYAFSPPKLQQHGIIVAEGDLWKEHRRFALSTLRDFGVGRPLLESRVKEEIDYLSERFSNNASSGTPFDPQILVTFAVSNIINQLIFGRRFDYEDQEFKRQFTLLSRRISTGGVGVLSPFMLSDKLAHLALLIPMVQKIQNEVIDFVDYVERLMKKTASTFDRDSDPSNYIHAFMKAAGEQRGDTFTDLQLLASVVDLFIAGTETSSTTLRWAILFLAHHSDIQEKLHQEIRDRVGTSSVPDFADRTKLPFTEAVIMETQRLANLAAFGVVRRTLAPTKLRGYDIPEDAIIMPFLTNVLWNPDIYPNPQKFDPYRFLDASGKVIRDPKLIPFLAGKRICLGESLARMELFLFLVGLCGRFRFYFPDDQPKPTLTPVVGITCSPAPYQVCVEARSD